MKKRRILRSERGFTLVELGIVMAIIAILAAVAYPTYTGMRGRAYVAEARAIMQEIRVDKWAQFVESGLTNWKSTGSYTFTFDNVASGTATTGYNTANWWFKGEIDTDGTQYTITAVKQAGVPTSVTNPTLVLDTHGKTVE